MEVMQYVLFAVITVFGLFAGMFISALAKDERMASKKYLQKFILPVPFPVVYTLFGVAFVVASFTNYFFLTATIIFLYSIIVGSFLFVEKKNKELFISVVIFVFSALVLRFVTIFLF